MLLYWLLLVGSLVIGIPLCRYKWGRGVYCGLFGVIFFLIAAIRDTVGYDYNLYGSWYYKLNFQSADDIMYNWMQEKGFIIPFKFLSDVFPDYQAMFVVIAFIVAAGVMSYIYIFSERPYLSVFFFLTFGLFFNSMNFMRQIIAAIIMAFAVQYIKKKQFIRFIALVALAITFHISAIIFVVFYFLLQIPMNWISLGVYGVISAVGLIFSVDILNFFTQFFYSKYAGFTNREVTMGLNPVYCVFFGIVFLVVFLLRKPLVKKDKFNNVLINCMFFIFFFELMGTKHGIVSRFALLFLLPVALQLMPQVVEVAGEKCVQLFKKTPVPAIAVKIGAGALAAVLFCTMYGYMLGTGYNGSTPYQTVFDDKPVAESEEAEA